MQNVLDMSTRDLKLSERLFSLVKNSRIGNFKLSYKETVCADSLSIDVGADFVGKSCWCLP